MRACWLILLLAWTVAKAAADTRLPGSTSPDSTAALFYRELPSAYASRSYEFYLRDPQSLKPLSGQIVPMVSGVNAVTVVDENSEVLFQEIGDDAARALAGGERDRAFSYAVVWSPDSNRVAIEGGAHKFWHLIVFHRVNGSFQNEELPTYDAFVNYYRTQKAHLRVSEAGAERGLQTRIGGFPDDLSNVCWLSNTTLAVSTYPYLLNEAGFPDRFGDRSRGSFFMLDFKRKPTPAMRGFCW